MSEVIRRHWFVCVLAFYVLYGVAFIFRSSTVIDGHRHFVLLDDAMISMTYARNLARGHGAVWYPGAEPVEGYSNPSWMLFMAAVHLLPLPPRLMSLPIQLMGIVLIGGALLLVKAIAERLAPSASPPPVLAPFLAVTCTAFYLPLNSWTLRGMEVGLLAFGMSLAVWAVLQCQAGKPYQWWTTLLLGFLTTVRMDAVIVGALLLGALVWTVPQRRWRTLVMGIFWLALFIGVQLAVQKFYYHDWLPNTYYLKLDGVSLGKRVAWGLYVLFHFLSGMGLWLLPLLAFYVAAVRSRGVWLLLAVIGAQTCYSVYVGGDAWEWWGGANRYLCDVMPLLFVLIASAVVYVANRLFATVRGVGPRRAQLASLVMGIVILVQVNSYEFGSNASLAQELLLQPPMQADGHWKRIRLALALRRITSPRARIAVVWAGILPYFSERQAIDLLGKSDRQIAKLPDRGYARPPIQFFASAPVPYCWPGHTKHDYRYSIEKMAPDVIAQLWDGMEEIVDVLRQRYRPGQFEDEQIFFRNDSTEINLGGVPARP
jgi:arabinofuranosyltransferase